MLMVCVIQTIFDILLLLSTRNQKILSYNPKRIIDYPKYIALWHIAIIDLDIRIIDLHIRIIDLDIRIIDAPQKGLYKHILIIEPNIGNID